MRLPVRRQKRAEAERLRRLDRAGGGAVGLIRHAAVLGDMDEGVGDGHAGDGGAMGFGGFDRARKQKGGHERTGGVMDQHDIRRERGESFQPEAHGLLPARAAERGRNGLARRERRANRGKALFVVGMDGDQQMIDAGMHEKRLDGAHDDGAASQHAVLFRNVGAVSDSPTGGDDQGGDQHGWLPAAATGRDFACGPSSLRVGPAQPPWPATRRDAIGLIRVQCNIFCPNDADPHGQAVGAVYGAGSDSYCTNLRRWPRPR